MRLLTRALQVGYGRRTVATIPDLSIEPGRVWLVTGPNGCGKSTLLKTLAGLLPPVSGEVEPLLPRGTTGAVFVHSTPVLFRGSLEHNLRLAAVDPSDVAEVAARFGLQDRLHQRVDQLSHGTRQRTALARAILARPALLLLDEPEGGLDESALAVWRAFAADTAAGGRLTLVIAAHRPAGLDGIPTEHVRLGSAG